MDSRIETITYPNGEIQRYQAVRLDAWETLDFWKLQYEAPALDCFASIYRNYLVPACPPLFGNLVMFCLPEGLRVPFPAETEKWGTVADPLTAATVALRKGLLIRGGRPHFANEAVGRFYRELEQRGCIRIVRGWLPITTVIPLGNTPGYLTRGEQNAALKVNASFFIMDSFDCATVYDQIGTVLGLQVKNGEILNPPLYDREALLVRSGNQVSVETPRLEDLQLEIHGQRWKIGENACCYTRPRRARTPRGKGIKLVVVGCRVAAVCCDRVVNIPASGFVLCPEGECHAQPGDQVVYHGMEDVLFGIQVGNSILVNGKKTRTFHSKFYNIRHLEPVPYPPSLYPMDFARSRAARIALGADGAGRPVLLWAEGAGKHRYIPGQDSRGATLLEMGELCTRAGMVHGVNLDGGGSAQILLRNRRELKISDRNPQDNSEAERPVPLGLIVRE